MNFGDQQLKINTLARPEISIVGFNFAALLGTFGETTDRSKCLHFIGSTVRDMKGTPPETHLRFRKCWYVTSFTSLGTPCKRRLQARNVHLSLLLCAFDHPRKDGELPLLWLLVRLLARLLISLLWCFMMNTTIYIFHMFCKVLYLLAAHICVSNIQNVHSVWLL